MAFDPDEYLKENTAGGFDPDAYLAQPEAGPTDKTSAGMAALEHYGNTATMGYLPHLQAGVEKLLPNPTADVDSKLEEQGFSVPSNDQSYLSARDENRKRLETESKEHPYASGAGTAAGVIAGAALPAANIAKGATLGAKALAGAKTGALYGAIANPGDTEGEYSPVQLGGRAKNAAIGAGIGAAAPVAIEGVSRGAQSVKDFLSRKAALKATRALGRPTPTQATKMAASGQDVELGRELLDSGAIPVLGTPGRIAGRVETLQDEAGEAVSDLIKRGGDSKLIDAERLGIEILDSPELAQMRTTPGMENTAAMIEKQVETLAKNGKLTLKEAQKLRQGIDKSINFNKAAPEMRGAQEGLYKQRTAIRDAMNEGINSLPGFAEKDALLKANRKYGRLSEASEILEREIGRDQANRSISLTDTIAGAAGASTGNPAAALALGAANKFGRTFGNSIQARVYDSIAKKAGLVPGAMEKVNPQVASMIAQRAALRDPRFQENDDPILKDPQLLELFRKDPGLIDSIADETRRTKIKRSIAAYPKTVTSKKSDGR